MTNEEFFDILEELRAGINKLDQTSFLQPDYNIIIAVCEKMLKGFGYGVKKPHVFSKRLNTMDDLIHLFNELYKRHFPEFIDLPLNINKERSIASKFVKARMEAAGLSKDTALQECGEIVRTIFGNTDRFGLDPPFDFGIFGQDKMVWITNKAVHMMNEKILKYEELRLAKESDKTTERLIAEGVDPGWSDEKLNKAIKTFEEKGHGKKERKKAGSAGR